MSGSDENRINNEYGLYHLVLSSFYGLNRSFSKKIFVGLDVDEFDTKFKLVYRICGNNINTGFIDLNYLGWKELKNHFPKINDYFQNRTFNQDEVINHEKFSIKFTKSFFDRAVEISYEEKTYDGKKSKISLVLKRVTFETLKSIAASIDHKCTCLFYEKKFYFVLKEKFIDYIISCLSEGNKKLISQVSARDVRIICEQLEDKTSEILHNSVAKEKPEFERPDVDNSHLFLKELSALNFEYVLCSVSKKLNL